MSVGTPPSYNPGSPQPPPYQSGPPPRRTNTRRNTLIGCAGLLALVLFCSVLGAIVVVIGASKATPTARAAANTPPGTAALAVAQPPATMTVPAAKPTAAEKPTSTATTPKPTPTATTEKPTAIPTAPQPTATTQPPTPAPAPAQAQEITGSGAQAPPAVTLNAGLTTMWFTHSGRRNFIVTLLDKDARPVDLLVNRIGPYDGTTAIRIPTKGAYTFNVEADGVWKISLTQLGPAEFAQAIALPQSFKGKGAQNTPLFTAQTGSLRLALKHGGQRNFIVRLLDSQGRVVNLSANVIGPFDGSKVVRINARGVYILVVEADGEWTIDVTQ